MATRMFMSAKDIYQYHHDWAAAGVNISSTPSGHFLLASGDGFITGHRKVGLGSGARAKASGASARAVRSRPRPTQWGRHTRG